MTSSGDERVARKKETKRWPVQNAKARFSELLEASLTKGPQIVTRRGEEMAVLVRVDQWRQMEEATRPRLKTCCSPPHRERRSPYRCAGRGVEGNLPPSSEDDLVPSRYERRLGIAQAAASWIDLVAQTWNVLSVDARVFRSWATLMHRRPDHLIEDALIAATAIVHHLVVVTRNTRDFASFRVKTLNPFAIK